jgi:metal-responsive CopG/Arc/MetJ family transcriptional regulator
MMYDVYIKGDKMIRTQIYLTEEEKTALNALSVQMGKRQSEIIREAVDRFLARYSQSRRQQILDRVAGIWKYREDLPEIEELRKDWDRGPG